MRLVVVVVVVVVDEEADEVVVVVVKMFLHDILVSPSSTVETFVDCGSFRRRKCRQPGIINRSLNWNTVSKPLFTSHKAY